MGATEHQDRSDSVVPIRPAATETARKLLNLAMMRLGWKCTHVSLGTREEAVRQYILSQFPLRGRAPSRREILEALALRDPTEVQTILERLAALDFIALDPESQELRSAYPFSTRPTKHLVRFHDWAEAKPVYALCAVDALGVPFMLNRDVSIASSCAHCSGPITIRVHGQTVMACTPAETVVWRGTGTMDGECVATAFCPTVNFFCSSAHVAAWQQDRPDTAGSVLNLGEALYLGKGIFEDLLKERPRGTSSAPEAAQTSESIKAPITATATGGLVAAVLAAVCCIGPLVLAALGVGIGATGFLASTASFLKALLPYRPLFIGLTALLLGVAFYLTYRSPRAACTTNATCASASGNRMNRTLLWIVSAIALALVLAPYWLGI